MPAEDEVPSLDIFSSFCKEKAFEGFCFIIPINGCGGKIAQLEGYGSISNALSTTQAGLSYPLCFNKPIRDYWFIYQYNTYFLKGTLMH